MLHAQGDLVSAQSYFEQALSIDEQIVGPDHLDTATSLNNLGMVLMDRGDLAAARRYLERPLAIEETTSGPDYFDNATSVNNIGFASSGAGRPGRRPPIS